MKVKGSRHELPGSSVSDPLQNAEGAIVALGNWTIPSNTQEEEKGVIQRAVEYGVSCFLQRVVRVFHLPVEVIPVSRLFEADNALSKAAERCQQMTAAERLRLTGLFTLASTAWKERLGVADMYTEDILRISQMDQCHTEAATIPVNGVVSTSLSSRHQRQQRMQPSSIVQPTR